MIDQPPSFVPYILLVLVFMADAPTWSDYAERARKSEHDKSSMLLNSVLGTVGLLLGLMVPWTRHASEVAVPPWLAWSGVLIALLGVSLRFWAIRTLGSWFSLTVQVRPEQPVIDHGPYRLIRHPSYAGADLALLGVGLTCGNWLSALFFVLPFIVAHMYRIAVEEEAMVKVVGAPYVSYASRTKRLIPYVY